MAIRFMVAAVAAVPGGGSGAGPGARAGDGRGRGRPRDRWRWTPSRRGPGSRARPSAIRRTASAERADRQRDQEMAAFDQAYSQMDAGRWDRAVEAFARVAAMKGTRADGALYWQAYSQDRIGQRAEALATIAELAKTYPASRYVKQAQALEMEVRRNVGQPVNPEAQGDEELKLIAVNSLLNSDPEKALPILEKLLQGPASPRVRERAVFVLAQSNSPRAREILKNLARGSSTPELQSKAIQYLGVMGGAESRATPGRGLLVVYRRRRQASHPARLHGLGRQAAGADRGADRAER